MSGVAVSPVGLFGRVATCSELLSADVLIADATIGKTAVTRDAMRVVAGRERPDRNGNAADVGGREQTLNTNNVPIDVLGDLSAMAATLPGITLIPGADGGARSPSVALALLLGSDSLPAASTAVTV